MKNFSILVVATFSVILLVTVTASISLGLFLITVLPTPSAAVTLVPGTQAPSPTPSVYSKVLKLQISPMMMLTLNITNPKFETVQTFVPQIILVNAETETPSDLLTQYHDALKGWRDKQAIFFQQAIARRGPMGNKDIQIVGDPNASAGAKAKAAAEMKTTANLIKLSENGVSQASSSWRPSKTIRDK